MSHSRMFRHLLLVAAASLTACGSRDREPVQAIDLNAVAFHVFSPDLGVHPSTSVLRDPNNPFTNVPIDELNNGTPEAPGDKWQIDLAAPAPAAFYAWATALTGAPGGENQYYTATKLQKIYTDGLVTTDELESVRELAIAAFSAQLVHFPQDYNRDAQGNPQWDYATGSLKAIRELGGVAPAGWVLVVDADGQERAVNF
jgi:hypothetical protein